MLFIYSWLKYRISHIFVTCGENAKLCARVVGIPRPTLCWKKGNEDITNNNAYEAIYSGENCCLVVKNSSKPQSGVYTCYAENIEGKAECVFQLEVNDQA